MNMTQRAAERGTTAKFVGKKKPAPQARVFFVFVASSLFEDALFRRLKKGRKEALLKAQQAVELHLLTGIRVQSRWLLDFPIDQLV